MSDQTYVTDNTVGAPVAEKTEQPLSSQLEQESFVASMKQAAADLAAGRIPSGITDQFGKPLIVNPADFDKESGEPQIDNPPAFDKQAVRTLDASIFKIQETPGAKPAELADIPDVLSKVVDMTGDTVKEMWEQTGEHLGNVWNRVMADEPDHAPDLVAPIKYADGTTNTPIYDEAGQLTEIQHSDESTWKKNGDGWDLLDKDGNKIEHMDGEVTVNKEGDITFKEKGGEIQILRLDNSLEKIDPESGVSIKSLSDGKEIETDRDGFLVRFKDSNKKETFFSRNGGSADGFSDTFFVRYPNGDLYNVLPNGRIEVKSADGRESHFEATKNENGQWEFKDESGNNCLLERDGTLITTKGGTTTVRGLDDSTTVVAEDGTTVHRDAKGNTR